MNIDDTPFNYSNVDDTREIDIKDILEDDIKSEPDDLPTPNKRSKAFLHLPNSASYKDSKICYVKPSNHLRFQPTEFVAETYAPEKERSQFEAASSIIRWRYRRDSNGKIMLDDSGKPLMESNARLVKWTDGTYQIVVGDDVFNITTLGVKNSYIYHQTTATKLTSDLEPIMRDNHHPETTTSLECVGKINERMLLRNVSRDAERDTRKVLKMSSKFTKVSQVSVRDYETLRVNPQFELEQRIRDEQEELKRERKMKQQYRDSYSGSGSGYSGYSQQGAYRRPTMSADYMQNDSDEDDEGGGSSSNITAIKKQFKPGYKGVTPSNKGRKSTSSTYDQAVSSYARNKVSTTMKRINKNSEYIASDEERSVDHDQENDQDRDFIVHDSDEDDDDDEGEEDEDEDIEYVAPTNDNDDDDDDESVVEDDEDDKIVEKKKKTSKVVGKKSPRTRAVNKDVSDDIFKNVDEDDDEEDEEDEDEFNDYDSNSSGGNDDDDDDDEDSEDEEDDVGKSGKKKSKTSKKSDNATKKSSTTVSQSQSTVSVGVKRTTTTIRDSDEEDNIVPTSSSSSTSNHITGSNNSGDKEHVTMNVEEADISPRQLSQTAVSQPKKRPRKTILDSDDDDE